MNGKEARMIRILIADDSAESRKVLKFMIGKQPDVELFEAKNGLIALDILSNSEIDVLITDIKMPHMDGLELMKKAHEINSDLYIIVFSAFGDFNYAKTAMKFGVVNYLLKPINADEFNIVLTQSIKTVLDKKKNIIETLLKKVLTEKYTHFIDDRLNKFLSSYQYCILLICDSLKESQALNNENHVKKTFNSASIFSINEKFSVVLIDKEVFVTEQIVKKLYSQLSGVTFMYSVALKEPYEILEHNSNMRKKYDEYLFKKQLPKLYVQKVGVDLYEAKISYILDKAINLGELIVSCDNHIKAQLDTLFREMELNGLNSSHFKYITTEIIKSILQHISIPINFEESIEAIYQSASIEELKQIVIDITEFIRNVTSENDLDNNKIIRRALEIIETEYHREINRDIVARKLYLSPAYFSSIFKKRTGKSFVNSLTEVRMEKAKDLLLTTDYKISQICEMVGYKNYSYFCAQFKRMFNQTCAEYRENKS